MFTKILIGLVALCIVGGGAVAAMYVTPLGRNMFPQFFVARAATNTVRDFMPLVDSVRAIIPQIQNSSLRHESTVGISRLEGRLAQNIPPAAISVFPMVSLRNVTLSDRDAFFTELFLQMAATPIFNANLHLERGRAAVGLPMLFDYNIIVDPRHLGRDIDASIFGDTIVPRGMIDDELFYRIYSNILFAPRDEIDINAFISILTELALHINFEYSGQEEDADVFNLTIPQNRANTALSSSLNALGIHIAADFAVTEDIPVILTIADNRLSAINFIAPIDISGVRFAPMFQLNFPEAGRVQIEIIELTQRMQLDLAVQNNDIAITSSVEDTNFSASATGTITLVPDAWRVEADFRNLSLQTSELDIALHARYMMTENTAPVLFDSTNARHLTDLNILDLLGALARIEESPLGGILGGVLP